MKYRRNPHTGLLDDSGAILGAHGALSNPTDAQDLADKLDLRSRMFRHNTATPSTLNITNAGSDSTGDGSVSLPFLTIDRALQFIGLNNPANVTLAFGAGTFTMPPVLTNMYNITFTGTVSTSVTDVSLPVASITTQTNTGQLVFTITRGVALANDAWRGRIISFANAGAGPTTLTRAWVYRNVGNTLYCTVSTNIAASPLTTSSTISLLSLDTTLRYLAANNSITNSSAVQVTGCQITGDALGRVMFFVSTDKWQFNDCYFAINRPQIGQAGGAFFFRCYLNNLGDTTEGILSVVRGGNCRLGQGTVIDTQNAATNEKFVRVAQDAKFSFDGPVVMRGMEVGFKVEGAAIFTENGVDVLDVILFENGSGTVSNTKAFTINTNGEGSGGTQSLPLLSGAITGNYAVESTNDSFCRYTSTSTLVTALGTNYVSADAGVTTSSQASDATSIKGAFPAFSAEFSTQTNITFANSPYALNMQTTKLLQVNTLGGVTVVNLPAANAFTAGAVVCVKSLANGSINACNIVPAGANTIDLVAALYPIAMGVSVYLATDGVNNWNII